MLYGRKRVRQGFGEHKFYPEPEKSKFFSGKNDEISEKLEAEKNRSFFSPYSPVKIGNWRKEEKGFTSNDSKTLVRNIKNLEREIEELRKSIETSTETVNNENPSIKKAIKLINEKNENITDLQILRLKEGFGNYGTTNQPQSFIEGWDLEKAERHNADYILHRYVIQCIIRLRFPYYDYGFGYSKEIAMKDFEISKQEEHALESIKNETTDTYNEESKIKLFGIIKDMPIIPIEFAWLLDKRIVKEELDKRIVKEEKSYKLFGWNGIFEILLPNKEERKGNKRNIYKELDFDLSYESPLNRYMSETDYKVFLKIWTANVIAKYIFKIYHDTSFTYIKGKIYPTIGECMSKMDITEDYNIKEEQEQEEEQLKIIKEDAKQRIILEADEPMVTIEKQKESPLSQKPYGVNKLEGDMTDPFEITTNYDPFEPHVFSRGVNRMKKVIERVTEKKI